MKAIDLEVGKWYTSPWPMSMQVVDIRTNSHGEMSAFFSNGVSYPHHYDGDVFELTTPPVEKGIKIQAIRSYKKLDSEYFQIKSRHEELCRRKLMLNSQGKNTTMRNAYINQELELLRSRLSEYRYEEETHSRRQA